MKEIRKTTVYTCDLCHLEILTEVPTVISINDWGHDFHNDCAANLMMALEFLTSIIGMKIDYVWRGFREEEKDER